MATKLIRTDQDELIDAAFEADWSRMSEDVRSRSDKELARRWHWYGFKNGGLGEEFLLRHVIGEGQRTAMALSLEEFANGDDEY